MCFSSLQLFVPLSWMKQDELAQAASCTVQFPNGPPLPVHTEHGIEQGLTLAPFLDSLSVFCLFFFLFFSLFFR